jgi:DNA-binding MarR family transcriptional regulator
MPTSRTATNTADHSHETLMRVWGRFIRLNARIEGAVAGQLRDVGLSIPQFDLLAVVYRTAGATQQDIADRLLVTKGNVSGLVDRLTEAGLLERRPTQHDRRSYSLHLTEAGTKFVEAALKVHERFVAETLGRLGTDDLARFEGLLISLRDAVRAHTEPGGPRPRASA